MNTSDFSLLDFRRFTGGMDSLRRLVPVLILLGAGMGLLRGQSPSSSNEEADHLRQQGLASATSGRLDEALATFKKGLALAPDDARLLDATGAVYSIKGDLQAARRYFTESLRADPTSTSTRQNLGIALFTLGNYEEASQQFTRNYQQPGSAHTVASLFLGLIAQRQSDCKRALPLMEAAGSILYRYPDALLSYSDCELQAHDAWRAEQALAAFDKLQGDTSAQYRQAGALYERLGRSEMAARERAKAGPENGHATDLILKRAVALEQAHRLDDAQKLLESEISSHATFELVFELAKVARERGDFALAMKSLKQAAEMEPDREDSYLEFSSICADHGNDQLALESAEIGLDHVPGSYRLTVQKGAVEEKLGHFKDAEEILKKALSLQKDNSVALVSLAVVQAHSGRPDEAERTLEGAIRSFPENDYMQYFRAKLLLQTPGSDQGGAERRDTARRLLETSIRLNPQNADSYYQLSETYLPGSPQLAEQALRRCLELDPSHIPAQYSLARLYIRTGRKSEGEALLARMKTQQRSEELQQQKQLRIEVAHQ